jgi:ligand-binding sensor domain-containing protein
MQKLFVFILTIGINIVALAQPKQILFNHFGLEEGFSSKEALGIAEAKNGLLWISSNNGLVKYDSKSFIYYQHNANDSNTITNNLCKKILFDKRECLWIISYNDLDILDTKTKKIKHIKHSKDGKSISLKPTYFYYDSINDIMYIGSKYGLYFCKNGKLPLQSVSSITANKKLQSDRISTIISDINNNLWISSYTNIIKLNTTTGKTEEIKIPDVIDNIDNNPDQGNLLSAIITTDKTIYYGTWCRGLIEFNTITKKFHQYKFKKSNAQENTIQSIVQLIDKTQEHLIWLGTFGAGLCAFDVNTKKFTPYIANTKNEPNGIKGNLYGMYTNTKALWIGSETGLHCYDFNKQIFKTLDVKSNKSSAEVLPISDIIIEQNQKKIDEKLWYHIPYYNSYQYNLLTNKVTDVPNKIAKYVKKPTNFLGWFIDSKNNLYISTQEYGLVVYNISTDEIIMKEKIYFFEEWKWVNSFLEDDDKNIWFGTFNGMYIMHHNTTNIEPVATINNFTGKDSLANAIMSITQDENKNIWFTADYNDKKNACIGKYNLQNNKLIIVYNEKIDSKPYNQQVELRTIISDKKGKIFVTFFNENIQWFNNKSTDYKKHNIIDQKQGLNSYFIDQLLPDTNSVIWLTNTFGISYYKSNQNTFTNYNFIDYGLDVDGNPFMYFSPNTHQMYIGQTNKICLLQANLLTKNEALEPLIINELKVFNKPMNLPLQDGSTIHLTYKQNFVSVNFAILSYSNSAQNNYAWYLQGLETEWNIGKNNIANYTSLSPGEYKLWMKAANSFGNWTKPISITIIIAPPFYKTWWFITLCICAVASCIYYFVQMRINRIKEKFQLRNKIASDLHDEIGSTLTSISILSKVSQQAMDLQPLQAKQMLAQISSQSKTIQQNMSDIVWSIRPDNEKMEDLLVRMREYASQTLEPLHIAFQLEADEHLVSKTLPMFFRKDVLLIYKEAINNIAKHANATESKVILSNGNKQIKLLIQDNGTWKGSNSGTGTKTMQERAKAIGATITTITNENGTKILLIIPIP